MSGYCWYRSPTPPCFAPQGTAGSARDLRSHVVQEWSDQWWRGIDPDCGANRPYFHSADCGAIAKSDPNAPVANLRTPHAPANIIRIKEVANCLLVAFLLEYHRLLPK